MNSQTKAPKILSPEEMTELRNTIRAVIHEELSRASAPSAPMLQVHIHVPPGVSDYQIRGFLESLQRHELMERVISKLGYQQAATTDADLYAVRSSVRDAH